MVINGNTTDLHIDARVLYETARSLDADVTAYAYDEDLSDTLEADLIAWAMLEEANRTLAIVRAELAKRLAEAMPDKRMTVMGVGVVERHMKKHRVRWQSDDLLRVVLDTRRVNEDTGEIESDVDKIKHVYPLAGYNARVTALRERGIDPDDFCEIDAKHDKDGNPIKEWSLQLTPSGDTLKETAA